MGHDNINTFLLKLALPYIAEPLTYIYIYITSILNNVFPTTLKKAKVIPLSKTNDFSEPNNFRPISILPLLSKAIERHIHKHLLNFLTEHNLLCQSQSGFRPQHSYHTALAKLCDNWLSAINNSEVVGAIFLDLKKAFGLVNHNILLKKLSLYTANSPFVSLLKSYLELRPQSVYVNGEYSNEGIVCCGIPQGSILGLLVFSLYIIDLPLHITTIKLIVTCLRMILH